MLRSGTSPLGPEAEAAWGPWPTKAPPQIGVLAHFERHTPVCALVGAADGGSRGRYGLIGTPTRVATLTPGSGRIAQAIDQHPTDGIRVLALGYEMGNPEVSLEPSLPPPGQPAGVVLDLDSAWIIDHASGQIAPFGPAPPPLPPATPPRTTTALESEDLALVPQVSDREHQTRIQRTLGHIRAGDIYQANISRPLHLAGGERFDAVRCLAALVDENPVAHAAYLRAAGVEVLSNSMETLLHFDPHRRMAASHPIKGTRHRDPGDKRGGHLLAADPKERAEHIMIVDLVRNDLGRVCVPGSVKVPELLATYGFSGVWHGISTVTGTLDGRHTPGELFAALFPGGSITGAPKRRAMQIIQELEQTPRGFYTGSVVWIMPNGWLSASILIRTLVRDRRGWTLGVGGGIVADSKPEREICETWEKVEVFRRLLTAAHDVDRGAA